MKALIHRLLLCGLVSSGSAIAADRPHILVYLSDDHSQYDSRLYGRADIPTPEMEALAKDGMLFTHAFVASPSCAPSRAALLTGLMPARNGAEANHSYPHSGIHSLVADLQEEGYKVASFGKVAHGGPKEWERYGFDHIVRERGHDGILQKLASYMDAQGADQPLCLFVGTTNPHVAWPMDNEQDPEAMQIPPIHLDTPMTRKVRAAYVQEIVDLDALLGDLRRLAAEKLGEDLLFLHSSDHGSQWPFAKWNLYDYGTRVPLIVSWPGRIEAGSTSAAMVSWIDLLPTLIEAVGGTVPEDLDGRSFLSVLSGEADQHRERIFTTHSGDGNKNVFPIRAVRSRNWKLIHNLRPDLAHTNHTDLLRKEGTGEHWVEWVEAARTDPRAKQILDRYYQRPEFELFHVGKDPWEQTNLIDDPAQGERVAEMKAELKQWMVQQGDEGGLFNEPKPISKPEMWHPDFFGSFEGL